MPALALTYTLTNGTTANADQVMADFNDIKTLLNTTGLDADNIAATSITGALLATDAVTNVKVAAAAAITPNKLAVTTAGYVVLGATTTGIPTYTALSGDVTVTGGGVTAIGAGKVTNAMLAGSITYANLALASGDVPVAKLAAGTSAQVLLNTATPTPTWTTLSGDATVGATGTVTVANAAKMTTTARARVYRSTTQTYTGLTKVAFNAESFDTGSNFDAVTNNRFTCPTTGTYLVTARLSLNSYSGRYIVLIYKNGTEYARGDDANTNLTVSTSVSTWAVPATATDYLEIFFNPVTGAVTNQGASNYEKENYATFDFLGA